MSDDYFTCGCVFEADRIDNAHNRENVIIHRVPLECRTEEYWRRRSQVATDLAEQLDDPKFLIERYGKILEHVASEDHRLEDWCRYGQPN